MNFLRNGTYVALVSLGLVACGGGGTSNPTDTKIDKNITIANTALPHVVSLGIANTIHANISLGNAPKDVYVLLSNYSSNSRGDVSIVKSNKETIGTRNQTDKRIEPIESKIEHPLYIETFKKSMHKYTKKPIESSRQYKSLALKPSQKDSVGDSMRFYLGETESNSTVATAKKIVSNISTEFGNKTLNIWVSDDSFSLTDDSGCPKKKCVTQNMVDILADNFLKSGSDNDIYDWVSNVYGEEWGSTTQSNLISQNDEITILLTDIPNTREPKYNTTDGGILGFFFPKDNFIADVYGGDDLRGSNERIMLYADAVLFANGDGSWDIDDEWPKEMISTLIHEFQHVIHFYQKSVRLAELNPTDTWINEMLAETAEDLIATKINHTGSRGVDPLIGSAGEPGNTEGRYPLFNRNNTLSLTQWEGYSESYSTVNAFGAFLIRNYGGAKVLHDILHNTHLDEQAVVSAVNKASNGAGKTFNDLLKEWGTAVLLSDNDNLEATLPTYNTGEFTLDSYKNSTYKIGSVNFFNYSPQPYLESARGTIEKQGNYYYKVGSNLRGDINIDLSLNGQTEATLIVK
jgi:hypothetical protein